MLGHSALPRLNPSEHRWPCFYPLSIANHPPYWKKLTGRAAAHGYPSSGSRLCLHTILCDVQRLRSDGGWNSRISTRSPVRSQDRLRPSAQREAADAFRSHGLREFLTRPRDYSPVVAKHLLFDRDGLLATTAFI